MIFQKSAASYSAESRQMMKAVVVHKYGGPEELKFEEFPDPVPSAGEVLVRIAATSINPFDIMRRSGAAKDAAPIKFPGVVGVDLSGTILKVGPGVSGFAVGDQVFAMADQTYAELCVVKASSLAKIPAGLDLIEAAALPLVTTTGNQLISVGTGIRSGQTVLVTGAVGNVGRSAVFTAKDRGAVVIAGVLKRQDRRKADCQSETRRRVRVSPRSSRECQGFPIRQSGLGVREPRRKNPSLHGSSCEGWKGEDSYRPEAVAQGRGAGTRRGSEGRRRQGLAGRRSRVST